MEGNSIICSWVGVFKTWLIAASFWDFLAYFGVLNETLVTLVIDIFNLGTNREISLLGCTFRQRLYLRGTSTDAGAKAKFDAAKSILGISI